jgi:hypothetical protein
LLLAALAVQNAALRRRERFAAEDDVLYLPRASALRVMSLGHTEAVADLVLVRALVYFGGQMQQKGDFSWLDNYLSTVLALAPGWKSPYLWAGVATMYNGRPITNAEVLRSNHFLELGVKAFPADWELAFMLGCNYLFELKSDDPAQRAAYKRQGGEWVRHAALVGGAPVWVPLLAATILRQEGQDEAAVRHLEEVYYTTQDERTRQEVRNRLVSLKAKVDFAKEERERAAFERAWKESLPYAPPDFFVAVGPRLSRRLDLDELARDPVLQSLDEK